MDEAAPPPSATRDWSLLPLDALASVFVRLRAVDVLKGAGLVCRSWLDAAKVPDVWRVVDMDSVEDIFEHVDVWEAMAKAAVERSHGQLRVFTGKRFLSEEFLEYLVKRSPSLTTLRIIVPWFHFTTLFSARVIGAIRESPLRELRSLELDNVAITVEELVAVLENCPVLEVLTVRGCFGIDKEDEQTLRAKLARIKTLTF